MAGAAVVALAGCRTPSAEVDGPVVTRRRRSGVAPVPITSVVVVGDSITAGSSAAVSSTLVDAGIPDVRVEGKSSRRIEVGNGKGGTPLSGLREIEGLLAEGVAPSAWVIELGTNDIGSYPDAIAYGELIDAVVALLPPDVPLVWVNTYREQYLEHTNIFNLVLEQRMTLRGNAVIADWFALASAPDQKILQGDHIHPNKEGQQVLALLMLQALQRL